MPYISASALVEPSCYVEAEVVKVGIEIRELNGEEYESNYLNLKVLSIEKNEDCPLQENQIFKVIDNYPGTFQEGDKIKAGVELSSAMGLIGDISFLQWSDLIYENGDNIFNKNNNEIIDYLQSEAEPVAIDTTENISKEKMNYNYFYIAIFLIIIVFIFYKLYKKLK